MSNQLMSIDEAKQKRSGRDEKGRFSKGNAGGPGGARPGSGRKPKPTDPTLLDKLYDVLDESAPKALAVLTKLLTSKDEKVRLKAAQTVLQKVLPDKSMCDFQSNPEGKEGFKTKSPEEEKVLADLGAEYARRMAELANSKKEGGF